MRSVAVISSGFLRNYRLFLRSDLYGSLVDEFDAHVYVAAWDEDGYGCNETPEYSEEVIPEERIRSDFGDRLCFLHRESFREARASFRYDPVMPLLAQEPHVLEKYRSKFCMVARVEVPEGYDAYFHLRFDLDPYPQMADAILERLRVFSGGGHAYASADILGRSGCFGDVFQIFDHRAFLFFQGFERRLYDEAYLSLDIPAVPERVLQHYFSTEMPELKVHQLPLEVRLNRDRFPA